MDPLKPNWAEPLAIVNSDEEPTKEIEHEPTKEIEHEPTIANEGRRYPIRDTRVPHRFPDREYVLLTDEGEPESFKEAKGDTNNLEWLHAKQDEMDSLHENQTYELTELPKRKKGTSKQVDIQTEAGRRWESAQIQSPNCGDFSRRRVWISTIYFPWS